MTRAAYFPIRPSGFKPSPAPYWNELNNAQALVGIGTAGLLTQTPNIIDNSNSLLAKDSAQEIIDNHINKAIIPTGEGDIYAPDPPEEIDLEEWKKRNILSTPIYEPNIDDYSTGGELPEIENTDNVTPIPEIEIPTHTGSPPVEIEIPNILYNKDLEDTDNLDKKSVIQIDKNNPFLYDIDSSLLKETEFEEKDISNYKGDKSSSIITTIINDEYYILDGHHRAKLAKKENIPARIIVIPEKAYKEMKEKGIHQANMYDEFIASYDLKEFGYFPLSQ